ncbi:MAG: DUF2479 domain-containing protein [Ruminococcaceae bacterium]|nr:DUF2479 domain-containing protein [Oscillospiraceae bacterium]
MTEVTKNITVDLSRKGNTRAVFARQNDKGSRVLNITLTDGGESYFVPYGTVAVINFLRSDGENASFAATVNEAGGVSYTLGLWALAVEGSVRCSISLYGDGEKKLTSSDFYLDVLEALYSDDDFTEDTDSSAMTALLSSVATLEAKHDMELLVLEDRMTADITALETKHDKDKKELEAEIGRKVSETSLSTWKMQYYRPKINEIEGRLDSLETKIGAIHGASGEVTISVSDWSDDCTLILAIDELGEYDMIVFDPVSPSDRDLITDHEVFISAKAQAGAVNVSARSKPTGDISLCYFIMRGGK